MTWSSRRANQTKWQSIGRPRSGFPKNVTIASRPWGTALVVVRLPWHGIRCRRRPTIPYRSFGSRQCFSRAGGSLPRLGASRRGTRDRPAAATESCTPRCATSRSVLDFSTVAPPPAHPVSAAPDNGLGRTSPIGRRSAPGLVRYEKRAARPSRETLIPSEESGQLVRFTARSTTIRPDGARWSTSGVSLPEPCRNASDHTGRI